MKCLFTFLCLSFSLLHPIVYELPQKGERKAVRWIRTLSKGAQDSVYFRIKKESIGSHEFVINCCTIDNDHWSSIALLSNRYIRIKKKYYPLILDYDDHYSLTSEQTLSIPGEVGCRDGLIKRVLTIFHGYSFALRYKNTPRIRFDLDNKHALLEKKVSAPIVYYINDSIENTLISILDTLPSQSQTSYFAIYSQEEDICQLELLYAKQEESLTKRTNRFLITDIIKIPLFFDYDMLFWLDENQKRLLVTDRKGITIMWNSKNISIIRNCFEMNEKSCYNDL